MFQPPDGVQAGGSPPELPPTPTITPTEDRVPGLTRQIVACTLILNPGARPPDLQDSGDPGHAELFIGPLYLEGGHTSAPNTMSQELPLGKPRITTHTSCAGEVQPCGRHITGAKGPGNPTPTIFTPSLTTVDVIGVAPVDLQAHLPMLQHSR